MFSNKTIKKKIMQERTFLKKIMHKKFIFNTNVCKMIICPVPKKNILFVPEIFVKVTNEYKHTNKSN